MNLWEHFAEELDARFYDFEYIQLCDDDMKRIFEDATELIARDAKTHQGKVGSNKQVARLNGRRRIIQRGDISLGYTLTFDHKNRQNEVDILKFVAHKTERGIIYTFFDEGSKTVFIMVAHYFDRIRQRLFKSDDSRLEILDRAFMEIFKEGYSVFHEDQSEVQIFTNHGLSLGRGLSGFGEGPQFVKLHKNEEPAVHFIYLKTFVDNSMLNAWQQRNREWAEVVERKSYVRTKKITKANLRDFVNYVERKKAA